MQNGHIFAFALDIVGVTVQLVQRCAQWLAIINLPETDASFQSAVILIINWDEFGQVETFKVVKIPEAKSNAAILCVSGNVLNFLVKVLAKFVLVGFILERNAIAQQIRNGLSGEVIIPV